MINLGSFICQRHRTNFRRLIITYFGIFSGQTGDGRGSKIAARGVRVSGKARFQKENSLKPLVVTNDFLLSIRL